MKRTVFVTGGNRGIGLAIACQLGKLGNKVLLASRDRKAGEEAARSLRGPGLDIEPVHLHLADGSGIDAALKEIEKSAPAGRCAGE